MYISRPAMLRKIVFLSLVLSPASSLFAAHDHLNSFRTPATISQFTGSVVSTKLPDQIISKFKFVGGLMFVEATVNGIKGLLLVDTGSNGFILLNSEHFKTESSGQKMTGMGGAMAMEKVRLESFEWQNLKLDNQSLPAFKLSQLNSGTEDKVLGLIGSAFFKEYQLSMNFATRELELHKKAVMSPLIQGIPALINLPFVMINGFPVVKASIGGKTYQFIMDTGSTDNVMDHSLENELSAIWKQTKEVSMTEGSGNGGKVRRGILGNMLIGGLNMEKIEMGLNVMPDFDKKLNVSGILGFQFLKYFYVQINYLDQTMSFYDMAAVLPRLKK
ncbi:aspartyl protease family protein [Pedobacter caeni]|uniref:Aspartyl protease n=1 Tax=Pedobacter caeni TaxID=288992 RepID=A0A1M5LH25_9SPHI|nr:aspartyl protease family protein [Pedobacter caeni]SHG64351.1 Aspartyl protease [Pedobacter caeni]